MTIPYTPTPPRGVPLLMYLVRDEAEAEAIAAEWLGADACLYRSQIIEQLYLFVPVAPIVWRGLVASVPVVAQVSV
jgi:hypothetical protein